MASTRLTRREILKTGALLAASALAASCAPKTSPVAPTTASGEPAGATSVPATAAPATGENITLHCWYWDNYCAPPWEEEAKLFHAKFPNLSVVIEITDYGEYSQKMSGAMAGGTPPDLTGSINEHFTNLAGKGQLTDLKPYVERDHFDLSDFLPGNLKQQTWKGTLVGIPFSVDEMYWYYLVDAFEKEGLTTPLELWKQGKWDWTSYLDLASKLTKGEGMDQQWGSGQIEPSYDYKFFPLIKENGGELFDPEYTKTILDQKEAMDAWRFAYEVRKYAPGPESSAQGSGESGKLAMWAEWDLNNTLYVGHVDFKYGIVPPPASPNTGKITFCGDAPGFAIPKGVKHPDESWEWMKWLETRESLTRVFYTINAPPPLVSMLQDHDLFMKHPNLPNAELCYELTQARMKSFYNNPKMSNYLELKQALSEESSLVWAGTAGLEEGVKKIVDRWNGLLKEADIDRDVN